MGNLIGGAVTLNACGDQQHRKAGVAQPQDAQNIPQGRAIAAGDDANTAGQSGQGALALRSEEPFCIEFFLEALEGRVQGAGAALFHVAEDHLVGAAGLVEGNLALDKDLITVPGGEFHLPILAPKHGGRYLCVLILKCHVPMAGSLDMAEVRYFRLQPDERPGVLENTTHAVVQLGDAEDVLVRAGKGGRPPARHHSSPVM